MPTQTHPATGPQSHLLTTVRDSQAAVVETIRAWTTISQQLTRALRLPASGVDLAGIVDRAFDVAAQALAAQRHLARTLAGVATRQLDTTVATVDTAVNGVETTIGERADRVEDLIEAAQDAQKQQDREPPKQPQAAKGDARNGEDSKQNRKPDRRAYGERSVDELRQRAGELQIQGRSSMSKDELITALRKHPD